MVHNNVTTIKKLRFRKSLRCEQYRDYIGIGLSINRLAYTIKIWELIRAQAYI